MVRHLQSCKARRLTRSIEGSFWFERVPGVAWTVNGDDRLADVDRKERRGGRARLQVRIYDNTPTSTQSRKTASRSSRPARARLSPAEHKSPQTPAGADHDVRAHSAALPARVAPTLDRVLHARGEEQVSWAEWEKPAKGVDRAVNRSSTAPAVRSPSREPSGSTFPHVHETSSADDDEQDHVQHGYHSSSCALRWQEASRRSGNDHSRAKCA